LGILACLDPKGGLFGWVFWMKRVHEYDRIGVSMPPVSHVSAIFTISTVLNVSAVSDCSNIFFLHNYSGPNK